MRNIIIASMLLSLPALFSCAGTKKETQEKPETTDAAAPALVFNADSAYSYLKRQVDFGPRPNNTTAHDKTAAWLESELRRHGAEVVVQDATLRPADGVDLKARNIMGMYNPQATDRLLLLAHYDTRPWADEDPDPAKRKSPVPGANDGASGVGILLEIARLLGASSPSRGVDILFVDAEDRGSHSDDESWALGARYFAENPIIEGYSPSEAILLDMTGAAGATFPREQYSALYAPDLQNRIWALAAASGYSDFFIDGRGSAVTDDHVQLIQAGIPAIDIIDIRQDSPNGFFKAWHTTADDMPLIDKRTLKAVGQTVTNYIFPAE